MIPIQSLSNQHEPCQKDKSLHQKVALIQKGKQTIYVLSLSLLSDLLLPLRQTRACVAPLRLERGIGPTCLPSASRAIEFLILKNCLAFAQETIGRKPNNLCLLMSNENVIGLWQRFDWVQLFLKKLLFNKGLAI